MTSIQNQAVKFTFTDADDVESFGLIMPMTDQLDLAGTLKVTHMAFDPGDLDADKAGTVKGQSFNVNVPELAIGIRYMFSPLARNDRGPEGKTWP